VINITSSKLIVISAILILALLILDIVFLLSFTSNLILGITAIIILWYTYETHLIRKYNDQMSKQSRRPSVGYKIFPLGVDPRRTGFEIVNYSKYPVAVKVQCVFKLDGKIIPIKWPAYNGEEYWNFNLIK